MPVFDIETPGGKVVTIEAPDEASAMAGAQQWHAQNSAPSAPQSIAQSVMQPFQERNAAQQAGAMAGSIIGGDPRAPKPAPPRPEAPFSAAGTFNNLTGGFNDSLSKVLASPLKAIEAGANLTRMALPPRVEGGLPPQYRTGNEPINVVEPARQAAVAPFDKFPATNAWERAARSGGNAAADAAPLVFGMPVAGALGAGEALAPTVSQLAQEGIPGIGRGLQSLLAGGLKYAGSNPISSVAMDTAVSIGSGGAAQVAREKGATPGEEMAATLAGGMVPTAWASYGPSAMAKKLADRIVPALIRNTPQDAGTAGRVAERKAAQLAWANAEPGTPEYSLPQPPKPGMVEKMQDAAADAQRRNAEKKVGAMIQAETGTADARANMQKADEAAAATGINPTLAERSGSQSLLNAQQKFESQMTGDELAARRAQQAGNQAAVERYADNAVPKVEGERPVGAVGPQEPSADSALTGRARTRAAEEDIPVAQEAAARENRLRTDTAQTYPATDAGARLGETAATTATTGPAIRQGYDTAQQAAEGEVGRLRQAIDPQGTYRRPADTLHNGIETALRNEGTDLTDPAVPPTVRRLLGRTDTPPGAPVPPNKTPMQRAQRMAQPPPEAPDYDVNSLLTAREEVGKSLRDLGQNTDLASTKSRRALIAVRDQIDAEVARIGNAADGVPGIRDRLNQYLTYYREQYAPNFRQDVGGEITAPNRPSGSPAIKNEDIPPRILGGNNVTEAAQNARVNPPGGIGHAATVSAALDEIRAAPGAIKDGMIQPEAVTGWLNNKRAMLEANPALRDAIRRRDPTAITEEIRNLNAQRQATQDASLQKLLGGDTKAALDKAVNNPEAMRELRNRVGGDAESMAALKRATWERLLNKGEAGVSEFINSPEGKRVFNIVYQDDPKHLRDIKTILDAKEVLGRSKPAMGTVEKPSTPDSFAREKLGQSVPSLINAANSALVTERASKVWTAASVLTRLGNNFTERQAQDALKAALFDPKLAEQLATAVKSQRFTPMQQKAVSAYVLMAPRTASQEDVQKSQPIEVTIHPRKGAQK